MIAFDPRTMMVFYPALSLVSINPDGSHNHPARDARALAQGIGARRKDGGQFREQEADTLAHGDPAFQHQGANLVDDAGARTVSGGKLCCPSRYCLLRSWECSSRSR